MTSAAVACGLRAAPTLAGAPPMPLCWLISLVYRFYRRYVWYLGVMKFTRDIASFGIIFWTPTIVDALLKGQVGARQPGGGMSGRVRRRRLP